MDEGELLLILSPYRRTENRSCSWSDPEIYYRFDEKDIHKILTKINELWLKMLVEKSELSAKVKVYEAIIENSNFKMAVVRKKKEEE